MSPLLTPRLEASSAEDNPLSTAAMAADAIFSGGTPLFLAAARIRKKSFLSAVK
jgi:hypothetical protein